MHDVRSVLVVVLISGSFITIIAFDPSLIRSLDRHVVKDGVDRGPLFFHLSRDFRLENQRHVFEDILKIIVIGLSCFNFGLAIESGNIDVIVDGVRRIITEREFYQLAAVNILILTGFRYAFVIFIRLFGRT